MSCVWEPFTTVYVSLLVSVLPYCGGTYTVFRRRTAVRFPLAWSQFPGLGAQNALHCDLGRSDRHVADGIAAVGLNVAGFDRRVVPFAGEIDVTSRQGFPL